MNSIPELISWASLVFIIASISGCWGYLSNKYKHFKSPGKLELFADFFYLLVFFAISFFGRIIFFVKECGTEEAYEKFFFVASIIASPLFGIIFFSIFLCDIFYNYQRINKKIISF